MDLAPVLLLVFLLAAVATVAISVLVQQSMSSEPTDPRDADRFGELRVRREREMRLSDDAGPATNGHLGDEDGGPLPPEAEFRQARAGELEEIARRERQYAERAEAEARRLREWADNAGPAPTERQARRRRAGIAPEDLDY